MRDAGDLLAEAALQRWSPRHQRELAALLDDGKPAARQFDRATVDALDPFAGPDLGIGEAQFTRKLAGDNAGSAEQAGRLDLTFRRPTRGTVVVTSQVWRARQSEPRMATAQPRSPLYAAMPPARLNSTGA